MFPSIEIACTRDTVLRARSLCQSVAHAPQTSLTSIIVQHSGTAYLSGRSFRSSCRLKFDMRLGLMNQRRLDEIAVGRIHIRKLDILESTGHTHETYHQQRFNVRMHVALHKRQLAPGRGLVSTGTHSFT